MSLIAAAELAEPSPRPLRRFVQDESRIGLQLPQPRRLTGFGVKPIQPYAPLYQCYWLYAAVEPATGQACWWEMPSLDSTCFEVFLQQLSWEYSDSLNLLIVDNAPAHTAQSLKLPDNVLLLFLPPYCPELNPIERLWQDLKRRIQVFEPHVRSQLQALREHVAELIRDYSAAQLRSLTGYDFILYAINEL